MSPRRIRVYSSIFLLVCSSCSGDPEPTSGLSCDDLVGTGGDCASVCDPTCAEQCDDGIDNDLDGAVDCGDPDCLCPEQCDDGIDNDRDGATDCDDMDCSCRELCDDGIDNDRDGALDCADPDCICPERCDDGFDNDRDGATDCDDATCVWDPACTEESCANGVDDDDDGLLDCEDGDCFASCREDCVDFVDNDGNGLVDCMDENCQGIPPCDGTVTVLGGQMQVLRTTRGHPWYPYDVDYAWDVLLGDVHGLVQTGGASPETCTWQFDSGFFDGRGEARLYPYSPTLDTLDIEVAPVIRKGFRLEPGCAAFTDSGFLPFRLMVHSDWVAHRAWRTSASAVLGTPWYTGPANIVGSSLDDAGTSLYSEPGSWTRRTTVEVEPVSTP